MSTEIAPAPKLTLRDLHDQLQAWRDTLEGTDDNSPDIDLIRAKFDQIDEMHANALDRFIAKVRWMASEAQSHKDDANRFNRSAKSCERIEADMRGYLCTLMSESETTQMKGRANTVSLLYTKDTVQITDASKIPADLKTTIPEQIVPAREIPDIEAIEAALRRGEEVPGAQLIPGRPFIRIT